VGTVSYASQPERARRRHLVRSTFAKDLGMDMNHPQPGISFGAGKFVLSR